VGTAIGAGDPLRPLNTVNLSKGKPFREKRLKHHYRRAVTVREDLDFYRLYDYCPACGVDFIVTPFHEESAELVVDKVLMFIRLLHLK